MVGFEIRLLAWGFQLRGAQLRHTLNVMTQFFLHVVMHVPGLPGPSLGFPVLKLLEAGSPPDEALTFDKDVPFTEDKVEPTKKILADYLVAHPGPLWVASQNIIGHDSSERLDLLVGPGNYTFTVEARDH